MAQNSFSIGLADNIEQGCQIGGRQMHGREPSKCFLHLRDVAVQRSSMIMGGYSYVLHNCARCIICAPSSGEGKVISELHLLLSPLLLSAGGLSIGTLLTRGPSMAMDSPSSVQISVAAWAYLAFCPAHGVDQQPWQHSQFVSPFLLGYWAWEHSANAYCNHWCVFCISSVAAPGSPVPVLDLNELWQLSPAAQDT